MTGSSLAGANDVQGQGGTWMRLVWTSMSGDTSGACCQDKLSYPAMSVPLPHFTHTNTHSDFQPFPPTPWDKERQEVWGDDEAIDRKVDLHSLRTLATTPSICKFKPIGCDVKGIPDLTYKMLLRCF